jgi:hypothetical protein
MKRWLISNRLYCFGALIGAVAGYLYYKFVGCVTGTCVISSNPVRSTLYFSVMGGLLFGMFKKEKKDLQKTDNFD